MVYHKILIVGNTTLWLASRSLWLYRKLCVSPQKCVVVPRNIDFCSFVECFVVGLKVRQKVMWCARPCGQAKILLVNLQFFVV